MDQGCDFEFHFGLQKLLLDHLGGDLLFEVGHQERQVLVKKVFFARDAKLRLHHVSPDHPEEGEAWILVDKQLTYVINNLFSILY